MKNLRTKLLATFASFGLTAALIAALSFSMSVSQKPAPVSADSVTGVVGYTLFAGNGITQTTAGTASNLRFFGTVDCYSSLASFPALNLNIGGPTMTNKLQHSYDGTGNWVDLYTFPAQVVTGSVAFTRSAVLGGFLRVNSTIALGAGSAVTGAVQCLAKNILEGR